MFVTLICLMDRIWVSLDTDSLGKWSGCVAVVGDDLLSVQNQLVGDGEGLQPLPTARLRPLLPEAGQPHPLEGGALHATGILGGGGGIRAGEKCHLTDVT